MTDIKPLQWTKTAPPAHESEEGHLWAMGVGGYYSITPDALLWLSHDPFAFQQHSDIPTAKAAAQEDHDPRARALLGPEPYSIPNDGTIAPLEWKPHAGDEAFLEIRALGLSYAALRSRPATLWQVNGPSGPLASMRVTLDEGMALVRADLQKRIAEVMVPTRGTIAAADALAKAVETLLEEIPGGPHTWPVNEVLAAYQDARSTPGPGNESDKP